MKKLYHKRPKAKVKPEPVEHPTAHSTPRPRRGAQVDESDDDDDWDDARRTLTEEPAGTIGENAPNQGLTNGLDMAEEFDVADKADAADAQQKTSGLKLEFDRQDVEFWFQQLEMHLTTSGVNAQWTKRLLLHKLLPSDIVSEVKDLLRKNKASAGATPYKDLKDRILDTFGKKVEDAYAEAEALVLTGKPSQLLNTIINKICTSHPNLEGCCTAGVISGMWRKKLPTEVQQRIAGRSMQGKDALRDIMQTADAVHATLAGATPVAALTAAATYNPALDDSADAPALQVAAVGRYSRPPPRKNYPPTRTPATGGKPDRGNPHPDGPPPNACNLHWKYGKAALKCRKEDKCPWAKFAPK